MQKALVPCASDIDLGRPIDLLDPAVVRDKFVVYARLLEEAPVCRGKVSFMKVTLVSRYEDCRFVLTDDRFVRNRSRLRHGGTARGANPFPFPMPKNLRALSQSMIVDDDPEHRRLRNLVNKAFTGHVVSRLEDRVEALADELLDELESRVRFDLLSAYARPIPSRVIAEMMGISRDEIVPFQASLSVLTRGFSGLGLLRTLFWDLRKTGRFIRELIERKRRQPGEDILSQLIQAEEDGDRLSEDELVAMVFLIVVAGFETTLHLIGNGARALLEAPDQLARLREHPELWESGVEEMVRFVGPIQGTKLQYATRSLELAGTAIERGAAVMPLLGAANRDPRVFERPNEFDVGRAPNHHLGFGFGRHFCLGRQLALMETRVALRRLFDRFPELRFTKDPTALEFARIPGWHRHLQLPMAIR